MKHPTFSICIPTIGRADLVKTALASLKEQTCQDFEVIISDSRDNPEVVSLVEEQADERIRVIHPPKDAGLFRGWDYAPPRFARGKYIMWHDDDNCLLPFTLELFADAIERTGADIVTANHVYFYDQEHPKPHMRRRLGIVPFSLKEYSVDLDAANRRLFSFSPLAPGIGYPRFHFTATVISRKVIQKIFKRLGSVLFADLPHMYSLYPVLFAFSKTCHYVDRPVAVVGRLGVSMGQSWSTSARKRFEEHPPEATLLSPISAFTKINSFYESYLRTKQELPDLFADVPIDENRFAEAHIRELFLLDTRFRDIAKNWRELFRFLDERVTEPERTRLKRKARIRATLSPAVFLSRRLRLHYLRRQAASIVAAKKERERPNVALWDREFSVPLPRSVEYDTIVGVSARIPELIKDIAGRNITWHKPGTP